MKLRGIAALVAISGAVGPALTFVFKPPWESPSQIELEIVREIPGHGIMTYELTHHSGSRDLWIELNVAATADQALPQACSARLEPTGPPLKVTSAASAGTLELVIRGTAIRDGVAESVFHWETGATLIIQLEGYQPAWESGLTWTVNDVGGQETSQELTHRRLGKIGIIVLLILSAVCSAMLALKPDVKTVEPVTVESLIEAVVQEIENSQSLNPLPGSGLGAKVYRKTVADIQRNVYFEDCDDMETALRATGLDPSVFHHRFMYRVGGIQFRKRFGKHYKEFVALLDKLKRMDAADGAER